MRPHRSHLPIFAIALTLLASACGPAPRPQHRTLPARHSAAPPATTVQPAKNFSLGLISFVSPQAGFGLSSSGRLVFTHDGGRTWQQYAKEATLPPIEGLDFVDHQDGWYWGGYPRSFLSLTTDSGRAWQDLPSPPAGTTYVHFWTPKSGVSLALGNPGQAPTVAPAVYTSSDGGLDWRLAGRLPAIDAYAARHYLTSSFPDPQDGWVMVGGEPGAGSQAKYLYHTSDGGRTWRLWAQASFNLATGTATDSSLPIGWYVSTIFFRSKLVGYLSLNRGPVLETTDGGHTWQTVWSAFFQPEAEYDRRIQFVNAKDGWLLAKSDGLTLWGTTNGGGTWRSLTSAQIRP